MRIFVHNVDSYIGRVLVEELRNMDGQLNRIFGTVCTAPEHAPKVVKRVVSREDPKRAKKMEETLQSCGLVVLDLHSCTAEDLQFAIRALKVDPTSSPPKTTGELEKEVIFVLVSSIMVWAGTRAEAEDGFLSEADYLRREPLAGSRFQEWKAHEDLVLSCFNREDSQVKGLVVAGGVVYGEGESTLCGLFKDTWRGLKEHLILAPGTNHVPAVHVRDLVRLIRQVAFSGVELGEERPPYFLAVDFPPSAEEDRPGPARAAPAEVDAPGDGGAEGEEEGAEAAEVAEGEEGEEAAAPKARMPTPSTQSEIVQSIIDEVSESYDVPVVPSAPSADGAFDELRAAMSLDLKIEPSKVMQDPEFAAHCEPPGMHCKEGLVRNVRRVAEEFCRARKLQALKVLVAGPPASGKTTLARAVSEHFRIPYLEASDSPDLALALSSKVYRYRGYVLDVGGMGYEEAERLFRFDAELPRDEEEEEEEEAADGEEGEEGAEAAKKEPERRFERRLNQEVCPGFVVVTEAPEPLLRARWKARGDGTAEQFQALHRAYRERNRPGEGSLADFFQEVAKIGILNLPIAGRDQEEMFESTRIYMEKSGRPFNYLPSEQEVSAEILARRQPRDQAPEEQAGEELQRGDDGAEDRERRQAARLQERLRLAAAHEGAQKDLQELLLRDYLMQYMVPTMTEGLIEMCKVLPDDPVDYLASYIEKHAADAAREH